MADTQFIDLAGAEILYDDLRARAASGDENMAAHYMANTAYAVGDYCVYKDRLYRCIIPVTDDTEAWEAGHWEMIKVSNELEHIIDISNLQPSGRGVKLWIKERAEDEFTVPTAAEVEEELSMKVAKPLVSPDGTSGQVLRTNGDGTTTWVDIGLPSDAQTASAVDAWLDDHPEATTTVADGSISYNKLNEEMQDKADEVTALREALNELSSRMNNYSSGRTNEATEIKLDKAKMMVLRTQSTDASYNEDSTYAAVAYDDSAWKEVTLPHDWSIANNFNRNSNATYEGGFLDGGDAWYRIELPIDLSMQGKGVYLAFDGIYMISKVYVNGLKVGENLMGYNPFRFDISDYISFTGPNVLAVYVMNYQISSRYYSGSGIYRPVRLLVDNQYGDVPSEPTADNVGFENITITTPDLATQRGHLVDTHITYTVTADPDKVEVSVLDADGRVVGSAIGNATTAVVQVLRPKLWEIGHGNLYTARLTATKDGVMYVKDVRFGYRYILFDASGFYLNGVKTFMKGVCLHHDQGCVGAVENASAKARQLDLMIEMGANAIRTTHNPEGERFLWLCAEKGLLVIEEFFDTWRYPKKAHDFSEQFVDHWQDVVRNTIARDKNNPAIVMWSIGNEINSREYYTRDGDLVQCRADASMIAALTKQLDPTRYTTSGNDKFSAVDGGSDHYGFALSDYVDVVGLNYGSASHYNTFRTHYPNKALYGSETTSALSSRCAYAYNNNQRADGVMEDLRSTLECSSYDNNVVSWCRSGDSAAEVANNHMSSGNLNLFGQFIWTGIDYIGEPTPYNRWPAKSSYFGAVDLAGFPKDIFWMYQSIWTDDPMIHILPMSWDYEEDSTQYVWLYSNCAKVELFMNGQSLGTQTLSQRDAQKNNYEYTVECKPGVLVANGYDSNNNLIAQDVLYTSTGEPAGLALKAWYNCVDYRTQDLAFIECDVVDRYGVRIPDDATEITFSVDGGTIVGTDNGNAADVTAMHSPVRHAYHGKALCVVAHDGKPGTMTVTAFIDGVGLKRITIEKGLYTGRAKQHETVFIDAEHPPRHPYVDINTGSGNTEPTSFQVVLALTNVTASNTAVQVESNEVYQNTFAADTGYEITSYDITMDGQPYSTAMDPSTYSMIIPKVTGNIVIRVAAEVIDQRARYSVTKNASHISFTNSKIIAYENEAYTTNFTVEPGYHMSSLTVTMGGTDITSTAVSNGTISIASVTGNIVITAVTAAIVYRSVSRTYTHVTGSGASVIDGTTVVEDGSSFTETLTPSTGYTIESVSVVMGETDITSTAYNSSTGVVSIAAVTADVVITATALVVTVLRSNFEPDGSTWVDNITIDFAAGDYIEAEIDLTACTTKNENILSIGTLIDKWSVIESPEHVQGVEDIAVHFYFPATTGGSALSPDTTYVSVTDGQDTRHTRNLDDITLSNRTILIKADNDNVYVNGSPILTGSLIYSAVAILKQKTALKIGSLEGSTRSHATYNYIKVVRGE